jgi:hypothetical protein
LEGQIADLNARLVSERDASDLKIAALSQDLSETEKKLAEQIDLLSDARRSPGKLVKSLVTFRILTLLLRMSPPLPRRMADNFARSAKKRDPERAGSGPQARSADLLHRARLPLRDQRARDADARGELVLGQAGRRASFAQTVAKGSWVHEGQG